MARFVKFTGYRSPEEPVKGEPIYINPDSVIAVRKYPFPAAYNQGGTEVQTRSGIHWVSESVDEVVKLLSAITPPAPAADASSRD